MNDPNLKSTPSSVFFLRVTLSPPPNSMTRIYYTSLASSFYHKSVLGDTVSSNSQLLILSNTIDAALYHILSY